MTTFYHTLSNMEIEKTFLIFTAEKALNTINKKRTIINEETMQLPTALSPSLSAP